MAVTNQLLMRRYRLTEEASAWQTALAQRTGWREATVSRLALARSLHVEGAPLRVEGPRRGKEHRGGGKGSPAARLQVLEPPRGVFQARVRLRAELHHEGLPVRQRRSGYRPELLRRRGFFGLWDVPTRRVIHGAQPWRDSRVKSRRNPESSPNIRRALHSTRRRRAI